MTEIILVPDLPEVAMYPSLQGEVMDSQWQWYYLNFRRFLGDPLAALAASRIMATDSAGVMTTVADLTAWIIGTDNQIIVTDNEDGTLTISLPDSIELGGLTANRILATDGSKKTVSVADLTAWIAGTENQVIVTSDGDGSLTLSTPQDIHTGAEPTFAGMILTDNLVLPKTSGKGIQVDGKTFGWRDLLGDVFARNTGATKPSFTTYRDTLLDYQFAVLDEEYFKFHIPHDYVTGSDIFLHIHWSHTRSAGATEVTGGTLTFGYEASYAKGHNQAPFPASISRPIIGDASATQYQHIISEGELSVAWEELLLNGTSDVIAVADDASIQNVFDGGGSVAAWLYVRSDGGGPMTGQGTIIAKGVLTNGWVFRVELEGGGEVYLTFGRAFDGNDGEWRTTIREVTLHTPVSVVITYDSSGTGNNPIIYVDGVSVGLTKASQATGTRASDAGLDIHIGDLGVAPVSAFDGNIAEVQAWTRILTPTEAANHASGNVVSDTNLVLDLNLRFVTDGITLDSSSEGNNGTVTGATLVSSTRIGVFYIDSADLEPDGVIILRFELTANDITVAGGAAPAPFIHYVDIHYQSMSNGTKDKVPDFYT